MASSWFLLSVIVLLNTYFVAGKNVEIARCLDVFDCVLVPEVNRSLIRQVEEQDCIPAHTEIDENIVDLACRYGLQISTCIDESGVTTTCPTFVKLYNAYQKLVRAACTEYDKDILAILRCVNDGTVQQGYKECIKLVHISAAENGYDDDTCRMIDDVQSCNFQLAKCNPKSVSRLETFLKVYKTDYCYIIDFMHDISMR